MTCGAAEGQGRAYVLLKGRSQQEMGRKSEAGDVKWKRGSCYETNDVKELKRGVSDVI